MKEKLKLESALRQNLECDRQKQDEIKRKEVEHQNVRQEVERKRDERRQKQKEVSTMIIKRTSTCPICSSEIYISDV